MNWVPNFIRFLGKKTARPVKACHLRNKMRDSLGVGKGCLVHKLLVPLVFSAFANAIF